MIEFGAHDREHAELKRLAYECEYISIAAFPHSYGEMITEWGVLPVTIPPSGDMEADIVAMHRAVHSMAGAVLAIADARPGLTN